MGALIDLNITEEEDTPSSNKSSASSSSVSVLELSAPVSSSSSVCLELWHACAGPLISLPRKGSVVVYLLQGHLEQVQDLSAAAYNPPPHLFCRVVDVQLHAEAGTDEVYAQVLLVPEIEQNAQKLLEGDVEGDSEEEDTGAAGKATTPHMFCKTLTASDTSTHGGFSVPRRAAEDCFPPLDYNQQRPSQELVAKDLHGLEWRFRHIYRGQPRRHLLTTGWSAFVNKKKLVYGDAVLFLRGEDGELRLGIRRAAYVKGGSMFPGLCNQHLSPSSPRDVVNAISMKRAFSVYYDQRTSSSEFIIPLNKFLKSINHSFSAGMRFKMRFETEDAAERRYTGLITGINDIDPIRWPGSKWRCIMVRWDDIETNRHGRVSPWEIEPSGSSSGSNCLIAPGLKRTRTAMPWAKPEFPVPNGIGASSDFGESLRFQKVLQGQEIFGFDTPFDCMGTKNPHPSEKGRSFPCSNNLGVSSLGNIKKPQLNSTIPSKGIGFSESFRFRKVLQGQEISQTPQFGKAPIPNEARREDEPLEIFDGIQVSNLRTGWPLIMQGANLHRWTPAVQVSSPSSVLMFQQTTNAIPSFSSLYDGKNHKDPRNSKRGSYIPETNVQKPPSVIGHGDLSEEQAGSGHNFLAKSGFSGNGDLVPSCKTSCRLFGFSLTDEKTGPKEDKSGAVTSVLIPGESFVTDVEGSNHPKPPLMKNALGSNCTNGPLQYCFANYNTYY